MIEQKKLIRIDHGPWQRPSLQSTLLVVGIDAPRFYDRARLEDTIKDIRNQTRELYCILIYDDGSTQDTHHNIHEIYGFIGVTWGREITGKRVKKENIHQLEFERSYLRFNVYPELKSELILFIEQWGWEPHEIS